MPQRCFNAGFVMYKVVQNEWLKCTGLYMRNGVITMIQKRQILDKNNRVVSEGSRQFKIWDDEKGYLFEAKNQFVKSFPGRKLSEFINNKNDFANLHVLAENIFKDTNMIGVRTKNIARPADIQDIGKLIGLCERRTRQFIDRMMQKGVIAKATVNTEERIEVHYYFNPLFFMSSKYLSPHLFMMFREQLKPYLKGWAWAALNEAANLKDVEIEKPKPNIEKVEGSLLEKAKELLK